jgi:hypothetical protein
VFFIVLTLLGLGWTVYKASLSNKDKMIIGATILSQIFNNTALVNITITGYFGGVGFIAWVSFFSSFLWWLC